jgi:metal-dependent amidase/aminoacylase/carboxypeptidase family protein
MTRIPDGDALAAVEAQTPTARSVIRFVHDHAELAHEEHQCSEHVATVLERAGFKLERGVGAMSTAFRATLNGTRPGRAVGLIALYDAVASIREDGSIKPVHSCGHGPIAGGVSAAALALAKLRDRLAGKIVVFGCPADEIHAPGTVERGSGKALSAAAGLWTGIDAALYAHPEFINTVSKESLWMRRDYARISGHRSLKAGVVTAPMAGLRPLADLVERLPPDQVMLEQMHLEGDVEEGTGLVMNATFLIFAPDQAGIDAHAKTLRSTLTGATWREGAAISGVRPNDRVTAAVAEAFVASGRDFVSNPPALPFATDFGNVSQVVPAALIGVGRPGGWKFHTDEGAREFAGPDGEEAALGIARVMTLAATRLTEPA